MLIGLPLLMILKGKKN